MLYSFRRCPYAMRARLAIAISQRSVRLREIILRDKPDAMLAVSKTATVPLLVDHNNVLTQSLDVMAWALAANDPEHWLASRADPLIGHNDGPFKHHLDRYKYASRYDDVDPKEHRNAGYEFLGLLNTRLADRAYLGGENRSFADMAIFPFVRQFRIADANWFDAMPLGHMQHWLSRLTGAVLFLGVMQKYPVWKDSGEEFTFPAADTS